MRWSWSPPAALRTVFSALVSIAAVIALWYAFLAVADIDPLVAKDPQDVWVHLFTDPEAGEHRNVLLDGLWQTLTDASVGFVVGLASAVAVAMLFVLSSTIERSFMPIALILRSVPLVAMTPVLTLVFGREVLATTVIVAIVVFVPALVNMVFGLRSAPSQAADLVRAYGGGKGVLLRKVMLPSALPALFVSARISVPAALIGALLAEWLATGKGLGQAMLRDSAMYRYDQLWSSVVAVTVASLLVYGFIGLLERLVLRRWGPVPQPR